MHSPPRASISLATSSSLSTCGRWRRPWRRRGERLGEATTEPGAGPGDDGDVAGEVVGDVRQRVVGHGAWVAARPGGPTVVGSPPVRVGMLTREYPPHVYGGAGVHVDFLTRELRRLVDVEVHCLGDPRPGRRRPLRGRSPPARRQPGAAHLRRRPGDDGRRRRLHIVHSHTWYANLAGHLAKLLYDIPHVVTSHSLEPQRPWKAEQLGGGYRLSSWAERTAYEAADAVIAVSAASRTDVLAAYPTLDASRVHVVYNGIDTDFYRPDADGDVLDRLGVDPDRPIVAFVGRITRQKGVPHLLRAALGVRPDGAAGAARRRRRHAGAGRRDRRRGRRAPCVARRRDWITDSAEPHRHPPGALPRRGFCAPRSTSRSGSSTSRRWRARPRSSPATSAASPRSSSTGVTGLLVHYDPTAAATYEDGLTDAVNRLLADPGLAVRMGAAGRQRADDEFGWDAAARKTLSIYESLGASR